MKRGHIVSLISSVLLRSSLTVLHKDFFTILRVTVMFTDIVMLQYGHIWNAKRDKSVENQKESCIIENISFVIKYVLYCAIYE